MAEPTEADVKGIIAVLQEIDTAVKKAKRGQAHGLPLDARHLARHVAKAHAEERQAVTELLAAGDALGAVPCLPNDDRNDVVSRWYAARAAVKALIGKG